MANWKYKLDLIDLITAYEKKEMTIEKLGQKIADRIREQPFYEEEEAALSRIANDFEECCNTVDDFDYTLNKLYNWGDITLPTPRSQMPMFNKMCWIATQF